MEGWNDPKADILRLVRSWLCDQSNGLWVMIVDNADELSVFSRNSPQRHGGDGLDGSAEPLSDFLPQSPNGLILITSRSQDVAYRLTGSHSCMVAVKPINTDDGLALLQKKLSLDADKNKAIELLQALDYMPLAIT